MALVSVTPPKEDKPHRLRCAGRGEGEGGGAAAVRAPPRARAPRHPQTVASAGRARLADSGRLHLLPLPPARPAPRLPQPRVPVRGTALRSSRCVPLLSLRPSPCSSRPAPAATGEAGVARVAVLREAEPPAEANGVPAPRPPLHPLSPPRPPPRSTARSRPPPPPLGSPRAALPRGRRALWRGWGRARLRGEPRGEAAAAISALRSAVLLWK